MNNSTIEFKDIETPTTVEGFRENLRKYYWCIDTQTMDKENLYVRDEWLIKVDELDGFGDLYSMTTDHPPEIIPLVEWDMDDVKDYMEETGQFVSCDCFFENTDKYTIYPSAKDFLDNGKPQWVKIDNQIVREFFIKTLGEFSGYGETL